jgi:4-O-beta-D-mannosyl-D-glucose phosphorylase
MHVATSTIDQLVDYVTNTPPDGWSSAASVNAIDSIIDANKKVKADDKLRQKVA